MITAVTDLITATLSPAPRIHHPHIPISYLMKIVLALAYLFVSSAGLYAPMYYRCSTGHGSDSRNTRSLHLRWVRRSLPPPPS